MSRKSTNTKSGGKSKSTRKAPPPNFPQHNLPEPYSRLQSIGPEDGESVYAEIADQLKRSNPQEGARRLLAMIEDESYYDYDEDEYQGGDSGDARAWTRLHALRTLSLMGGAGQIGIEPLIPLLDCGDDYLREDVPFYYAEMGASAVEPLARVLTDTKQETYRRSGAAESLAEIGEKHPELRESVIPPLELALATEKNDDALNGFIILSLCDLGSKASMPIIEAAFKEDRVDDTIVELAEVQEHFGLEVTAERPRWEFGPGEPKRVPPGTPLVLTEDDDDEAAHTPYIAPEKVGRNDPCPCGSGKKYKKCCGAAQ